MLFVERKPDSSYFTAMSVQFAHSFTCYQIPDMNTVIIGGPIDIIISIRIYRREEDTTEDSISAAKIMCAVMALDVPHFDG